MVPDARRVVLHVGLHKTGTTYLQRVVQENRAALAEQGVWVPGLDGSIRTSAAMAAWDLRGRRAERSGDRRQLGQWGALCAAAASSPLPTVLVSAESLSLLSAQQAVRAVAGFPDRTATVVVTCRDLGRVLPSAWQEAVRNGSPLTWSRYVAEVRDRDRLGRDPARGFWLNHDLPAVLSLWAQAVPPERLVVVTVPRPGAPRGELLARFAEVVGFDVAPLDVTASRTNAALGVAATEVVRRLNSGLGRRQLNGRQRDRVVRKLLTARFSAMDDEQFGVPDEELPWLTAEAERVVAAVRQSGVRVVGDLDDLLPRPAADVRRPDSATEAEVAAAALEGMEELVVRYARLWWRTRRAHLAGPPPGSLTTRAGSLQRRITFAGRRWAAAGADRSPVVARLVAAYVRSGRR